MTDVQPTHSLARIVTLIVGGIFGAVLGYIIGAQLGCSVFWPASNLCGLPGVVPGLPLGTIVGAMLARRVARPRLR